MDGSLHMVKGEERGQAAARRTVATTMTQSSIAVLRITPNRTYRRRPSAASATTRVNRPATIKSGPWVSGST